MLQVRNRYLHPKLGRSVSRDPIGYKVEINLYNYVKNNSINQIDAVGLYAGEPDTGVYFDWDLFCRDWPWLCDAGKKCKELKRGIDRMMDG